MTTDEDAAPDGPRPTSPDAGGRDTNPGVKLDTAGPAPDAEPPRLDTAPVIPPDASPPDVAPPPPPPRWPAIVGVGHGGRRAFSNDGVSWTDDVRDPGQKGSVFNKSTLRDVAYANNLIVAVGGGCDGGNNCAGRITVYDGQKWSEANLPNSHKNIYYFGVAHGGGGWVAVGIGGHIMTSSDGQNWSFRHKVADSLAAIAFGSVGGKPMFVAVGEGARRVRSVDGQTWTDEVTAVPGLEDRRPHLRDVAIGLDQVIAVGDQGVILTSGNGTSWDRVAGSSDLTTVAVGNGQVFAFGRARLLDRYNGMRWQTEIVINPPESTVAAGTAQNAFFLVGNAAPAGVKTSSREAEGRAWVTRFAGQSDDSGFLGFTFTGR